MYKYVFIVFLAVAGIVNARSQTAKISPVTVGKHSISNPVINATFADPTVIAGRDGKYYAYATQGVVNNKMMNIQVAVSVNLKDWKIIGDALPVKPIWADTTQEFWAPHVVYDPKISKYVMFFSGESNDTSFGKYLGVAFSDKPAGPFTDMGEPLKTGKGFINIDPMAIIEPKTGRKLLYWGSGFQPIKVQELSDDWKSFKAGSKPNDLVWPGKDKTYSILVEGAWVNYSHSYYYLFYSG
nr:family 43 glycosylhydrolase [Chitinophagaceae bacterium]